MSTWYSDDKVSGSRDPEWNGRGYGTINTYAEVIRENYYNPATGVSYTNGYRYKVTMTDVDVKRRTPYLEIRALGSETGGYYPTSVRISASDGNNGCSVKANEYKQLAETLDAAGYLFAYIGYSFTGTDIEVNFEKCKYNVSYNLAGGTGTSYTQEAEFNNSITLHSAPTRYGYTFAGWRCNRNGGLYGANADYYPNDWVGSGSLMNEIQMTAEWTPKTYTVSYNANKPSGASSGVTGSMASDTFSYDTPKALRQNAFSLTGWSFVCWNTSPTGNGTSYSDNQNVKNIGDGNNVTLYAQWKPNTYSLTFNNQYAVTAGTPLIYETYDTNWHNTANTAISKITVPQKTGMKFNGYFGGTSGTVF